MTTEAPPKPEPGTEPPAAAAEPEGLMEKIEEVVHKIVDPLLAAGGKTEPDPLDKPATLRDLEAFAAKQMKAEQGHVKPAKAPPKPPEAKEKAEEKAPPGVEQPPTAGGKPGWREKLWS